MNGALTLQIFSFLSLSSMKHSILMSELSWIENNNIYFKYSTGILNAAFISSHLLVKSEPL